MSGFSFHGLIKLHLTMPAPNLGLQRLQIDSIPSGAFGNHHNQ